MREIDGRSEEEMGVPASPSGLRPFGAEPASQSQAEPLVPNAAWAEFQTFRVQCADAARPILRTLGSGWPVLETYANAEYWAGWNAAIMHAASIAEGRHRCWQESTLGSSQPCDDISACEDIAAAIRYQIHRRPCASRPLASGMSAEGQDAERLGAEPASPARSEAEGDAQ